MRVYIIGVFVFFSVSALATNKPQKNCRQYFNDFSGQMLQAKLIRVVDGDTIKVRFLDSNLKINVRLLSIDTPETNYNGRSQGYWGKKATNFLKRQLQQNTIIDIELGEESCDRYGRILGYIWKDGVDQNAELLKAGLAVNYCIYPNLAHCADYARIVKLSMEQERGFFADPQAMLPYEWRWHISGRSNSRYIGSIVDHHVVHPSRFPEIDIHERVFFSKKRDIQDPYYYVE